MIIRQCTDKDIAAVSRFYDHVVQYLCAHINYPKWSYQEYPSADYVRQMTAGQSQFVCMDEDNHTRQSFWMSYQIIYRQKDYMKNADLLIQAKQTWTGGLMRFLYFPCTSGISKIYPPVQATA